MANILVIDDDALFRGLMKVAFERSGHSVQVAEDGEAGVAMAKDSVPDVVVTDMSMPKMTGWEVLDELKANDETSNVPVVVLSAHRNQDGIDDAHQRGCAGYLVKPVPIPDLLAKVEEILAA